jgi:hypothetical protein
LLRLPLYRKIVLLAALILGSHAMHDSFAMIRWSRAGISPGTSGILWSLSVAAEVVVFVVVGRPLLDRIGPAGAAVLSAGAGVVRWAVMAETAWLPALALIEPLHGLTFALLHLTCMRLLAQCVPRQLEATALTIYGTVGIGIGQFSSALGRTGFGQWRPSVRRRCRSPEPCANRWPVPGDLFRSADYLIIWMSCLLTGTVRPM